MAKNRMKKIEMVIRYQTDKGFCDLINPKWEIFREIFKESNEWLVDDPETRNEASFRKFKTRAEALDYIRFRLLQAPIFFLSSYPQQN